MVAKQTKTPLETKRNVALKLELRFLISKCLIFPFYYCFMMHIHTAIMTNKYLKKQQAEIT